MKAIEALRELVRTHDEAFLYEGTDAWTTHHSAQQQAWKAARAALAEAQAEPQPVAEREYLPQTWLTSVAKDCGLECRSVSQLFDFAERVQRATWLAAPVAQAEPQPVAPWPDHLGQPIQHGARMLHPFDGTEFVAVRLGGHQDEGDAWRAVYDDATVSRLCLQIGDKGRAVLVNPQAPIAPTAAQAEPLTDEQERAAFEAWVRANTTLSLQRAEDEPESYYRASTEGPWLAWLRGRNRR